MTKKLDDKQIEHNRYDNRAGRELATFTTESMVTLGSLLFAEYLRSPYLFFEGILQRQLNCSHKVLEIGAGSGQHTDILVKSGADVTATDISGNSLKLLQRRIKQHLNLDVATKVADMEKLPFDDDSFDYIVCAGSLSYGDPHTVNAEFKRVLKPGGSIICVDSLNHNIIYRCNRYLQYLRSRRSKSTLVNMPDMARIDSLSRGFANVNVRYFGAFSFVMPLIAKLVGEARAKQISDRLDNAIGVKKSAFKFVMVANDLRK